MEKGNAKGLIKAQNNELEALAELLDDWVDTADIPEALDWADSRPAVLYGSVKHQISLRLDADGIAWFKQHATGGRSYRTDTTAATCPYREFNWPPSRNNPRVIQRLVGRVPVDASALRRGRGQVHLAATPECSIAADSVRVGTGDGSRGPSA